jgi:hypothetical protein
VGVQQLVRERNQARTRVGVGSVIATTARAGGAWVHGLGRGMRTTTGCATAQTDQSSTGADRAPDPDSG